VRCLPSVSVIPQCQVSKYPAAPRGRRQRSGCQQPFKPWRDDVCTANYARGARVAHVRRLRGRGGHVHGVARQSLNRRKSPNRCATPAQFVNVFVC
jgi:hypothetical protein